MNFNEKIRAARGALDITREELAEMSNLSVSVIKTVEKGDSAPTAKTMDKLIRALSENGIKLTEKGVERDTSPIRILSGETPVEVYLKLLNSVHNTLKDKPGGELLITNADDKVSPEEVNDMYRQIRASGVKMRQLVEEGNTYLMGELEEYRYIPSKYFINRVTLIYANRVATITDDENAISINIDPINAETRRNLFNFMWDNCNEPSESEADVRF